MNYDEARRRYNAGEHVPSCFLSKDGRLRSKHCFPNGNPFMGPPIRQDTPYLYPEDPAPKQNPATPAPSTSDEIAALRRQIGYLQRQIDKLSAQQKREQVGVQL
ncbi:hypothetical protein ABFB09_07955 [Dehalogenimonas sp. THU2]|uniref:hypothetical protein n=1 Tax=Dehalogenimonas sp. THU2 TaxID=3151121 RepID=UPI003218936B